MDNTTLAQELEDMIYKGVEALGLWAFANRETILAALRTPAPAPVGGDEPVAWMYERNGCYVLKKNRTPEYTSPVMGHTEIPLYAEPQSPPAPEMPPKVEAPAADEVRELVGKLRSEGCRNGGDGSYAWRSRDLCTKAADMLERLSHPTEQPSDLVERDWATAFEKASAETARLQQELNIANADHIALWLEANTIPDEPMSQCISWLACRIVEAHERAIAAMQGGDAVAVERWQPIETAPKDGSTVLAYRKDAGVFTIHYVEEDAHLSSQMNPPEGDYYWFTTSGEDLTDDMPTHWMPMPDAPAAIRSGGAS